MLFSQWFINSFSQIDRDFSMTVIYRNTQHYFWSTKLPKCVSSASGVAPLNDVDLFLDKINHAKVLIQKINRDFSYPCKVIYQHAASNSYLDLGRKTKHTSFQVNHSVYLDWCSFHCLFVRRAGLLWSQQDFEWLWSVPLSSASLY